MTPDLLAQLPVDEVFKNTGGNGTYGTQQVQEVVILRGAIPIAPPRKNARMHKGAAFAHRNAAIAACRLFGRRILKVCRGYYLRSLVKTKMNCIKQLGEHVMSRTFEREVNELHIRAAILNRFAELSRLQNVAVSSHDWN